MKLAKLANVGPCFFYVDMWACKRKIHGKMLLAKNWEDECKEH